MTDLVLDLSHVHTNPDILKPHIFSSVFVWTRRSLKSPRERDFKTMRFRWPDPDSLSSRGKKAIGSPKKVCSLKHIQIHVDVALNARGFGWLSLHTAYFQVKKDCLRTGLSIGESNIYGKTASPCQLIFWAIGLLIWIRETPKKMVKRISRYPHNKLEAREGIS